MAITLVGSVSAASPDGAGFTSGGLNTTGANFLVAAVSSYEVNAAPTLSDSNSNAGWTGLTQQTNAGGARVRLFYCLSPTVGSGHTFTLAGAGSYAALAVAAFSGAAASSAFDQQNGATDATSLQTFQPGGVTPSEDNELLVAAVGSGTSTVAASTWSIDLGFTVAETEDYTGAAHFALALAYLVQTAAAAKNPTWTFGGAPSAASGPVAVVATFKAASGGGGTAVPVIMNQYRQRWG